MSKTASFARISVTLANNRLQRTH